MLAGKLTVTVHNASGIADKDLGKQDPYCIIKAGDQKFQTRTHKKGGTSPEWNEAFIFNCFGVPASTNLDFELYDEDIGLDDKIGTVQLQLRKVVEAKGKCSYDVMTKRLLGTKAKGNLFVTTKFEGILVDKLTINVVGASQIRDRDVIGKQDPYCIMMWGDKKFQTRTHKKGGQDPVWNEAYIINLHTMDKAIEEVSFQLYDEDVGRDDWIAELKLPLRDCAQYFGKGKQSIPMEKGGYLNLELDAEGKTFA